MSVLTAAENHTIKSYPLVTLDGGKPTMIEIHAANGVDVIIEDAFLLPHRKDYYFFAFVEQGNSRHWIDFTSYTVKPGHFYFTIPQQIHLKEESKPVKGYIAGFTEEFLLLEENRMLRQLPIIQNPADGHEIVLGAEEIVYIEDIMRKMAHEYKTGGAWQNQMLASWLRVLIIYLSRIYTEQFGQSKITPNQFLLKNFQELIGENHTQLHDVAAYANLLNLSPGYLNDQVKQQSGKTAISHIHSRLVVEAKRKLLHTDLSVKQIADELGFEDAAYFNRFFKRLTDSTPIAYRQQIREMYS